MDQNEGWIVYQKFIRHKGNQMNQKEAYEQIAKHVEAAHAEIKKAEALADEHGCEFSFDLAYGMGGTYYPKVKPDSENEDWESSNEGWMSSSSMC
jgi:hypothetical protein